jgi:hypothetical protein
VQNQEAGLGAQGRIHAIRIRLPTNILHGK